jgi:copper chaperone CopZ
MNTTNKNKNRMKKIILLLIACVAFSGIAFAQQAQRADRNSQETVVFVIKGDGIDCQGCVNRINHAISHERGVTRVNIDMEQDLVTVTFRANRTSVERLKAAFEKINFEVEVKK